MRRLLSALTIIAAVLVVAPAANAASTQKILTATMPQATDSLGDMHDMTTYFTYSDPLAGEDNCAYWNTHYRAVGATDATGAAWREVNMYHGASAIVALANVWGTNYGTKSVQFRIKPECNPASNTVTRTIEYLKPHTLDPKLVSVTVPTTVTADTISAAIVAQAAGYGRSTELHVLFATENGDWIWPNPYGSFRDFPAYKPLMNAPVSSGLGAKGLFVMVQDGNRDSVVKYVRFTRVKAAAPSSPVNNAPVLTAISTPATVVGSSVTVTVKASDDNAVKRIRFATEDGNWGAWRAYSGTTYAVPVSAGLGYKGVFVQVQDAGYKTSSILYRKYTRVAS